MMKKSLRFFCVVVSLVSSRVNDVSLRTTASMTSDYVCVERRWTAQVPKWRGKFRGDFFFFKFKEIQTGVMTIGDNGESTVTRRGYSRDGESNWVGKTDV